MGAGRRNPRLSDRRQGLRRPSAGAGRAEAGDGRAPPGARGRTVAPAGGAHHRPGQGRGGSDSPAAHGQVRRRPDGGRPGVALSRRACRGPLQAEDRADGPQRRQPPHRAGARRAAAGSGGTPARHGAAREPVRNPRHGEHDGRDADAHVCPRQGLGHGPGSATRAGPSR